MNTNKWLLIALLVLFVACKKETTSTDNQENALSQGAALAASPLPSASVSTFSTGLNNPRELTFGPDGNLYVAEAGLGGSTSSLISGCQQAPPPFGPYFGSPTGGRVSKIDASGVRTTVTNQLPTGLSSIDDVLGTTDVAFMGGTLYALNNGGCSHGVPSKPSGIYRVNMNGSTTLIADLSAYQHAHPVANPEEDDFEPDGSWYSMTVVGNSFYALEANHGELVKVGLDGSVKRVLDLSAANGHIVPTAIDYRGNFYIGNLGTFPIMGQSKLMKVTPDGSMEVRATGLNAILGVVVDKQWTYVLEMTSGHMFPTPGAGRIVAVSANGQKQTLVSGLTFPTGMTMGPDGNLYVSEMGFGGGAGAGYVSRVTLQ